MLGKLSNPFGGILSKMLAPRGDLLDPLRQSAIGGFSGVTSDDLRPDARISSGGTTSALRGTPGPANGTPKPVASGGGEIESYIRQSAAARGIDPDTAVRVARSEGGLKSWNRQSDVINKRGQRERSYGPFQLYLDGGLGNRALKAGIDPRDAKYGKAAIDFALDEVAEKGWGQWYGAAKVGVGQWDGVQGARALRKYASADERLAANGDPTALGGEMADRRRGEAIEPYHPAGQVQLAMAAPDQMMPPGTQQLPGSGGQRSAGGAGFQMEQASGMTPEEIQHPVARAVQAYRVNRTTRLLRGLSPAATIAALTAIGQDVRLRGEEQRAQETQQNARD